MSLGSVGRDAGGVLAWPALCALALAGAAAAQEAPAAALPEDALQAGQGQIVLDYGRIHVPDDLPIDLAGFHIQQRLRDGVYVGVGAYAPLVQGEYGGYMSFDVGLHLQPRLTQRLFATAGLQAGGGGGGRSAEESKRLSGTGQYFKLYGGLGYDFGPLSVGVQLARMRFRNSVMDDTYANVFVQVPFSHLTGPDGAPGRPLSAGDARRAQAGSAENMLSLGLDNYLQINPEGSNKGTIHVADLQYAHFYGRDRYWFAALGVGYRGRPMYNQFIGGVGQRWRLAPGWSASGQLGVGSGGYAAQVINTGPGLLIYPKASLERAINPDLGLALTAGWLAAPRASSRNATVGLSLNYRLRDGQRGEAVAASGQGASLRGFRFGLFHQTEFNLRYGDQSLKRLNLLGAQVDARVDTHWYVPIQAAVATTTYLDFPGYGEILVGLGREQPLTADGRTTLTGQAMVGATLHGPAVKASAGLRQALDARWSLQAALGHTAARHSTGTHFSAHSLSLGLVYGFGTPSW